MVDKEVIIEIPSLLLQVNCNSLKKDKCIKQLVVHRKLSAELHDEPNFKATNKRSKRSMSCSRIRSIETVGTKELKPTKQISQLTVVSSTSHELKHLSELIESVRSIGVSILIRVNDSSHFSIMSVSLTLF